MHIFSYIKKLFCSSVGRGDLKKRKKHHFANHKRQKSCKDVILLGDFNILDMTTLITYRTLPNYNTYTLLLTPRRFFDTLYENICLVCVPNIQLLV